MEVTIRYFGLLRELAGASTEQLTVADGASAGDALAAAEQKYPKLREFSKAIALAVNLEYSDRSRVLHPGDELALIPPVSGGRSHCEIVKGPIPAAEIAAQLRAGEDGAVVTFEGVVRDNTRGRRTLHLDYEAYEPMALKELEGLAAQALREFAIRDIRIVHRVGRMEIGETSVLIVVASAHRAAAFDACRFAIDTLKKKVPIWKKEHFEDGAVWADGEPFPPEVPTS